MDRLVGVIVATTLALALAVPQLRITPDRVVVGAELVVYAARVDAVLVDLEIVAELPDGTKRALGRTDAAGALRFVPEQPGQHVFRASDRATGAGLEMVAPCHVRPARSRWWTAAVCVPLGLALLWRNLLGGRSRRSAQAPS